MTRIGLEITADGARLAEERVRRNDCPHTFLWELPPPPLPSVRGLLLRFERSERYCRCSVQAFGEITGCGKTLA